MSLPLKPDCLWAVYGTDNGRHFVNQSAVPNSENLLLGLTVATSILFLKQTNKNIIRLTCPVPRKESNKACSDLSESSKGPLGLLPSLNHHLFRLWHVKGWQTTKANTNVGSRIQ